MKKIIDGMNVYRTGNRVVVSVGGDCDIGKLYYIFYGREVVFDNTPAYYKYDYGSMYPFNIITFSYMNSGCTIIADDQGLETVQLIKGASGCEFVFIYDRVADDVKVDVEPHEGGILALCGAIACYRNWLIRKCGEFQGTKVALQG